MTESEIKIVNVRDLQPLLMKGVNFDKSDAIMTRMVGYIPLLRAHNIKNMRINLEELMFVKSSLIKEEQYLKKGDIVFVTSSGSKHLVGKSALVTDTPEPLTLGAFNSLLRFSMDVESRYIFYVLNSPSFKQHIAKRLVGANINNIKKNDILDFKLPMPFKNGKPDLLEQKRIADRLNKVFRFKDEIEKENTNISRLFESVCRQEFDRVADTSPVKLSDVCNIVKGKFPTLKTPAGEYTFVVTSEKRKTANDYQFDDEAVCIPLISSTGHGHASLHRIHYENGKFALANIMVAVIPRNKNQVITKYLYYYLSFYKDELLVPLMRGVANVTIPLGSISEVEVQIPSFEEQKEIVKILEKIELLKSALLQRTELSQQLAESLLKSELTIEEKVTQPSEHINTTL